MKESLPTKAEQIEAFIHARAYDLTMQYAGRDSSGRPKYSKVFTITKKEVRDYVRKHYRLDNVPFVHSSPGQREGIYIIPIPDGYHVYYQERGIHFEETVVNSEDAAWDFYFARKFPLSGGSLLKEE